MKERGFGPETLLPNAQQQSPPEGRGFNPATKRIPCPSSYRLRGLTRASIGFALSASPRLKASDCRYFRPALRLLTKGRAISRSTMQVDTTLV